MNLDLHILGSDDIDPAAWDRFISRSPQGCLYALHGYATAVAPGWQGLILSEGDQWLAVMPLAPKQKWGLRYLPHPVFCQYWGIFFAPMPGKSGFAHYRLKHAIVQAVARELASFFRVTQNFAPEFDYPLPFAWKGFRLEARYTYHLNLEAEAGELFDKAAPALRRQVRKARKQGLQTISLQEPEALWQLIRLNLQRGNPLMGNISNWEHILGKVWEYLHKAGLAFPMQVADDRGQVLACGLFVRFGGKMLYLTGAQHPDHQPSGAMDLLMWEAICLAQSQGCRVFDFEGSMIEGVERFFRKFGAYPVSYLQIAKNELPLLPRWIRELR